MKHIRKFNESEQESTSNNSNLDIGEMGDLTKSMEDSTYYMEDLSHSMRNFMDGLDDDYFKKDDKLKSILSDVSSFVSQLKPIHDKIIEYLDDIDNLTDEAIEDLGIRHLKKNKEDQ